MSDNAMVFVVWPDGRFEEMEGGFENLRRLYDGGPFDFVQDNRESHVIGAYIDDEGMLNGALFNVPASIVLGRPIYGTVALCAAYPDDDGNTLPAPVEMVKAARGSAKVWAFIRAQAESMGQSLDLIADPSTIPPARIIPW